MSGAKLLLETLRLADGGKVVCEVMTAEGDLVKSMIEPSFFEEFVAAPNMQMSAQRQNRIVRENVSYLEHEAERLLGLGYKELVIR